jgi:hypothetical protein
MQTILDTSSTAASDLGNCGGEKGPELVPGFLLSYFLQFTFALLLFCQLFRKKIIECD